MASTLSPTLIVQDSDDADQEREQVTYGCANCSNTIVRSSEMHRLHIYPLPKVATLTQRCDVNFYNHKIEAFVTNDPNQVELWINTTEYLYDDRLYKLLLGLDLKWRSNFAGNGRDNLVALIQLCIGHRCLIFQVLWTTHVPVRLYTFMSNPKYTFVGVGIWENTLKLLSDNRLWIMRMVDIRQLAAMRFCDLELLSLGLKDLGARYPGKVLEKPEAVTLSQWGSVNGYCRTQ
ncbi:uncharacterized protein LOC116203064 [Punica granatum]|uniref:Uncharacterized protein LOC116203064 n=1 Tax=Punica granatum TaxID=22663 RepID=A0A6P8DGT0_PUNGR|nr:uncharacterized protein LOC116203064 [Punica granatum]